MKQLAGRKAVITGAASGIGRALALELARQQCDLFLLDIDQEGLAEVIESTQQFGVEANECHIDLAESSQVSHAVSKILRIWDSVDLLINNAGICYYGLSVEMSSAQWNRILAVNLLAPIQITRELLPTLLNQPQSHVVNMASMYGLFASPRCTAYHATKFGLVGFSEAITAEYKRFGLGVTTVCPGFVQSNLFSEMHIQPSHRQRHPPKWLCATPELVASRTVRAIRKNRKMVLVTPLARLGYFMKRLSPTLLSTITGLGRKKRFVPNQRATIKILSHEENEPASNDKIRLAPNSEQDSYRKAA